MVNRAVQVQQACQKVWDAAMHIVRPEEGLDSKQNEQVNDIRRLQTCDAPEIISAKLHLTFGGKMLLSERKAEDKTTDGKEQLNADPADLHHYGQPMPAPRDNVWLTIVDRTRGKIANVTQKNARESNESQSIDLRNESPRRGGPAKQADQRIELMRADEQLIQ